MKTNAKRTFAAAMSQLCCETPVCEVSRQSKVVLTKWQMLGLKESAVQHGAVPLWVLFQKFSTCWTNTWLRAFTHDPKKPFRGFCGYDEASIYFDVEKNRFPLTEAGKRVFQSYNEDDAPFCLEQVAKCGPLLDPDAAVDIILTCCTFPTMQFMDKERKLLIYCQHISQRATGKHMMWMIEQHGVPIFTFLSQFELSLCDHEIRSPNHVPSSVAKFCHEHDLVPYASMRELVYSMIENKYMRGAYVLQMCKLGAMWNLMSFSIGELDKRLDPFYEDDVDQKSLTLRCNESDAELHGYTQPDNVFYWLHRHMAARVLELTNEEERSRAQQQLYTDAIIDLSIALVQCELPALVCEQIVRYVLRPHRLRLVPMHYTFRIAARVQARWSKRKALQEQTC